MENILEKFTPEMINFYGISIHEEKMLCIAEPAFIGINIENIIGIENSNDIIKVRSNSGSVSLWKLKLNVHTTIF